ncbi:MAG: hypothetical protein V7K89_27590 [Nostoc sp.]|uniref:hypothetical protein n=1 Tax=Nostoc sp. TaxID=1180 RepID=UPI002FFD1C38
MRSSKLTARWLRSYIKIVIKGNTEGLYALFHALICAIAFLDSNGTTEVFCGDAEAFEVVVRLVKGLAENKLFH